MIHQRTSGQTITRRQHMLHTNHLLTNYIQCAILALVWLSMCPHSVGAKSVRGRGRGQRGQRRGYSRRAVRFLEPTLLLLLHHGPAHGYALIEQLSEYGLADVDPSAVYRVL